MYLPRFTDVFRVNGTLPLLVCVAALAGCAASPQPAANVGGAEPRQTPQVPPEVLTQYEQAAAALAAGDLTEAELRFEEFLLQYSGYPGAHVNLAIIHAALDDDKAAEAAIVNALALDAEHPAALNQLGMLRRRQGAFKEAETAYLKAVTADPEYALAHYNLGVLYELYLQQLDAALQHFERYLEIDGETGLDNDQVAKWVVDLRRRVGASHRTANVRE